ncbi:CAP domain-containing protein [Polaromonas sp.]|uniref:CAP domain-containing protein n=1 Tax=Polaromonas sp. TaxID=1869339 RepID=UPI0032673759
MNGIGMGMKVKALGAWGSVAGCLALVMLAAAGPTLGQATAPGHPPLLGALNALRNQGCVKGDRSVAALRENMALSRAAALVAGGRKLDDALKAAGYRAVRAAQITVRGATGTAALTRTALGKTCSTALHSELTEAGFHQRGQQVWVVLAAPFSPPAATQAGEVQARVLALVNQARAQPRRCGSESFAAAAPLQLNATLQAVAAAHAADMAGYSYFSHTGRDGSGVDDRASRAGYPWRAIGENIAAGQMQADAAVQGWIKSPGHCANLMAPAYTEMGAAFAVNASSSAGIYWVQVFGTTR